MTSSIIGNEHLNEFFLFLIIHRYHCNEKKAAIYEVCISQIHTKKRGYNEMYVAETIGEVRGWVIACKHIIEYENKI